MLSRLKGGANGKAGAEAEASVTEMRRKKHLGNYVPSEKKSVTLLSVNMQLRRLPWLLRGRVPAFETGGRETIVRCCRPAGNTLFTLHAE